MRIHFSAALLAAVLSVACTPQQAERPVSTTAQAAQSAPSAQPAPGEEIDGETYFNMVRGNTLEGISNRGADFFIYVAEDGTQRMVWRTMRSQGRDDGRMVLRDGRVCSTWRITRDGAEYCGRIFRDGDTFRSVDRDTGQVTSTFRIVPGNPRGL
jgi:hypothetical protein